MRGEKNIIEPYEAEAFGSAFDPTPEPFTPAERVIVGTVAIGAFAIAIYWSLPFLKSAATAALLFASAR
jgi:hypothetical protein